MSLVHVLPKSCSLIMILQPDEMNKHGVELNMRFGRDVRLGQPIIMTN